MADRIDLLIRNARLRAQPKGTHAIAISHGRITEIAAEITSEAVTTIDAAGALVTESFANPHLHLCKVYTLARMDDAAMKDYHGDDMGKAMTAIELAARVKEDYDQSWILPNVRRALALSALHGGTHVRGFADVDSKAQLEGVKALLAAREEFAGVVELQVVAFAQDGLVREPGAAKLLRQAMELGADVVGGIPWIEYTDDAIHEHIKIVFDLAESYDADVSMLVDDAGDPGLRSLEAMAVQAIERGWQKRALAHHARAMHLYPKPYLQKLAALLKQADMAVVTDPHTGPLHARVKELLDEGCRVCLGQDDISDAYYPFGRNSMLEVGFLASHMLWMTSALELDRVYDMISTEAALAMGVAEFEMRVGAPANLVVLEADSVLEAFRTHAAPQHVISQGKLVDSARMLELAAG